MTKFFTLAIGMAALALTLATPGVSKACGHGYGWGGWGGYGCCYSGYWGGYGGYYGGWCNNYVPSYYYASPGTVVVPNQAYAAAPGVGTSTASVRVVVPADAKVWIDGKGTKQTGSERVFEAPLTSGKVFTYEIKAQWREQDGKEVTLTRNVNLRANTRARVDFMTQSAE